MSAVGPELLARVLDEHGSALLLYARSWCDMPEDAVQEALLQLVRQPAPPDNLVAWLYRVVRNAAISASRKTRRRRRHEMAAAGQAAPWFLPRAGDRLDADEAGRALESHFGPALRRRGVDLEMAAGSRRRAIAPHLRRRRSDRLRAADVARRQIARVKDSGDNVTIL